MCGGDDRPRRAGRGEPRLVAARDDWALDGRGGRPAPARSRGRRPSTKWPRCCAICNDARVPVTAAAGRSGVSGGSVPLHGGVVLDLSALSGIVDVDDDVAGARRARRARSATSSRTSCAPSHGVTLGHWPQSIDAVDRRRLARVPRARASSRPATGRSRTWCSGSTSSSPTAPSCSTGGAPRAAVGPDLNQVFVGSEGTLGVITGARLRLHPAPPRDANGSVRGSRRFGDGLDACRRIVQRGATPAVLRLYDEIESQRNFRQRLVRAARARRRRRRDRRRGDGGRRRGVRRRSMSTRRRARRPVARAPQRRGRARSR